MRTITFRFDVDKLVQALAYFAHREVPGLTKLKAAKLLYFADKEHLLRYGRPIVGDVYYCLENGPVPSAAVNIMSAASEESEVAGEDPILALFTRYLGVDHSGRWPHFVAQREPDTEIFSESDIEILDRVISSYGPRSAWDLIQLTHREKTWQIPNERRPAGSSIRIPYQLFFAGADAEAQRMLRLVEAQQEDRDLAEELN